MKYQIHHREMTAVIDSVGAQLLSLKKNGKETIWDGDPAYWGDSSLILFPIVGRICNDTYTYQDDQYRLSIHGFASGREFILKEKEDDFLRFTLEQDEETLRDYPFRFALDVAYSLSEAALDIRFTVNNRSDEKMFYALGYHPGFRLDHSLGSYSVSFPQAYDPKEIGIVRRCMLNGEIRDLKLTDHCLQLDKDLFRESARVFTGIGDSAVLIDEDGKKIVSLRYDGFSHIVLWQTLESDAPFLCIEGWNGLPGRNGIIEDLTEMKDMDVLEADASKTHGVRIEI